MAYRKRPALPDVSASKIPRELYSGLAHQLGALVGDPVSVAEVRAWDRDMQAAGLSLAELTDAAEVDAEFQRWLELAERRVRVLVQDKELR